MTPQQDFAYRISERAQSAELRAQRALGANWLDAYLAAWRVMDEVYELVLMPDRPAQFLGLRYITGRGK